MPRIRQYAQRYADEDFVKEILRQKIECGIKSDAELARSTGISPATLCKRKKEPDTSTVAELRELVRELNPDANVLLKFLGYQITTKNGGKQNG